MALQSWSIAEFPFVNCRSASGQWTASGSGTNEYYFDNSGDALSGKPETVYINGEVASEGTLGALDAGEWAWGDNDTIGESTLYVRLSDGADPDGKDSGYIEAYCGDYTELIDSGSDTVIVLSLIVSNYDPDMTAVVTIKRVSSGDVEKFRWSLTIAAGDSPVALDSMIVVAGGDKLIVTSSVESTAIDASGDLT